MITRSFQAMGPGWAIVAPAAQQLDRAEAEVRRVEALLSRFHATSALSHLNRFREARCPELAAVTLRALALRDATAGAFDPGVGHALTTLGYDRDFRDGLPARGRLPGAAARPTPVVQGDRVRLVGDGALDLGGIAKGWTIDHLAAQLRRAGVTEALVDGGGDLYGYGRSWAVGVDGGRHVELDGSAVATSSTLRRRWLLEGGGPAHHLVSPETGHPADAGVDIAVVTAPDATTADALATAMVVAPARTERCLASLNAAALARDARGRWWATPTWS